MTPVSPHASVRTCPSCGAALNSGTMSCSSCGGLVAVESFFGHFKTELRYQLGYIGQRLREPNVFLWGLALCPIVLLPPILAIFLSLKARRNHGALVTHRPDPLVIPVAVCNIVLSVMLWHWIGDTIVSMGLATGLFLKSLGVHHPTGAGRI